MKKIFFLLLITANSLCSVAQNKMVTNEFQKMEFNDKWQKDTIEYFSISHEFKPDTVLRDFHYSQRLKGDPFQFNQPDSLFSYKNYPATELRMPVIGGGYYTNMPIAVPDSSVHYYLQIKRFPFFNTLEKKHK